MKEKFFTRSEISAEIENICGTNLGIRTFCGVLSVTTSVMIFMVAWPNLWGVILLGIIDLIAFVVCLRFFMVTPDAVLQKRTEILDKTLDKDLVFLSSRKEFKRIFRRLNQKTIKNPDK